jgi:hypothetical protein
MGAEEFAVELALLPLLLLLLLLLQAVTSNARTAASVPPNRSFDMSFPLS